ncbi:MAG: pseudouridine-5'-phosphate glycosidase [Polyangia bacterium]
MLRYTDEVQAALDEGRPVVALESTIVAHGLPWPENYEIGRALEAAVREHGATPATIAVLGGVLQVGLDARELETMAQAGATWPKTGAADLAIRVARRQNGATTVSATAFIAARAGIRIFSTGGIGGVHRGDGSDVSSDLPTLARTPIGVVSAGMKSILDLPRTLEYLETLGVPVVGFRTSELPAFYTDRSGLALEHRVETAEEAALVLHHHFLLHPGGVLLANPIPKAHALDGPLIERAIEAALADVAEKGLRGKVITPHLLGFVAKATNKRALAANRALAIHNAEVGAQVAVALSRLQSS